MLTKSLLVEQSPMTSIDVGHSLDPVEKSARRAKSILDWVHQGTGDSVDSTIKRVARRFQVPFAALWGLRYRLPKEIGSRVYVALEQGYREEFRRQEAKLEIELDITRRLPPTPGRLAQIRETEARLEQIRREYEELG
jgi:hypothetical protein